MRLTSIVALVAGAAAGFTAAKRLLSTDELPEQMPEPVRRQAERARQALLGARDDAGYAFREGRQAREQAKRDLMNDYLRRAGRPPRP